MGISLVRRKNARKSGKTDDVEKLLRFEEDLTEAQRRPANRTRFFWKPDGFTLNTPTEPIEKLLFCSFDNHRITADAKGVDHGMMCLQFFVKPAGPLGHAGYPVNLCDRSPHELTVGTGQQRSSAIRRHACQGEFLRHSNEVAQRFLSLRKLYGTLEALSVPLQAYAGGWNLRSFDHETVCHRNSRADRRDLCVASDHGNKMCLRLSRRIGQHLPDKAIQMQLDASRCFLCALHIHEPAEPKMCVLHSDSFFSWVRIWVLPFA